jgi:hypothetical protein
MNREIPNRDLTVADIPPISADFTEIGPFALTFNGYNYWGSFNRCAEIANRRKHDTLTELRTCLFFEQRRWHHFDRFPDEKAMEYLKGLIEAIREKVASGEVD